MSASDNDFEQYLNELNDIGMAWAHSPHGLHGPTNLLRL